MVHAALDIPDNLTGIALIPDAVEVFRRVSQLNDQVTAEVFRRRFAALLAPQPQQRGFVVAHDNAGVGAADKRVAPTAA